MSDLGLVEMTRQRVRASHLQNMTQACPTCRGTGRVFTPETIVRRVERSIRRIDPTALRTRLGLAVIVFCLLPLIASVAFLSRREESAATAEALRLQQRIVGALSHDIGGYIRMHRSLGLGIAAQPGLLAMAPGQQEAILRAYQAAYPDVASIALPRPMLYISGTRDTLFPLDGVKAGFAKLNACYGKAGAADRCQTTLYDSPHQFSAPMQAEAWAWLERFV